jgi:hypothetical protein
MLNPYLAFSSGREALPPQAPAKITIAGGGVRWQLDPQWSVRADYSFEDRKQVYRHHTLATSLSYRF